MLRNKPRLKYCGLTIVLSNPSRFDNVNLLSATAGTLVNNELLRPEFNLMQCDIRLSEDTSPLLEGTKCLLLCGEKALSDWLPKESSRNTLNELRGSCFYHKDIPTMASFFPQDAADRRNLEHKDEGESDEEDGDEKEFSRTKWSNYAFWLGKDIAKCKHILTNNLTKWPVEPEPIYKIYPSCDEVINALNSRKDSYLYFF